MKYDFIEVESMILEEDRIDLRERTLKFALRVVKMFCSLPKTTVAEVIGKQALRSGTSVGANFREASRARSNAEFIAKLGICLQELDETAYWLELLVESKIIPKHRKTELIDECNQLTAILTSISKKLKNSQPK